MRRVLIFGAGSYIGESFARYANKRMAITMIDSYSDKWKKLSFADFDTVLYAAGIAHVKQTKQNRDDYFAINRDLAISVAQKAKAEGVSQFIYLSSMAVYGVKKGKITAHTKINPGKNDYYAQSKQQAEELLLALKTPDFCIAIVRPPMVYGSNCPGKFGTLVKVAKKIPFSPILYNRRSMIFIDNLSAFLVILCQQNFSGVFCPHNAEYICTAWMLSAVARALGRKVVTVPLWGWTLQFFGPFRSLYYTSDAARMPFSDNYQIVGLEESIHSSLHSLCTK